MQDTVTNCLGLITQYNPLQVAPGGLARAKNAVNQREGIIEPRRGHKLYFATASAPDKLFVYEDKVVAHNGTTISYDNAGSPAAYSGSYSAPSGFRMRSAEAQDNLYVTTSEGVKVFTDTAGTAARRAGAPRALDPSFTLTGVSGFLANGSQCAYRCVIVRTDANDNVLRGYPSQRLWVPNAAGGSRNVQLTQYLPSEAIAGDVVQVYRTEQVTGTSADDSGDEMGLVYQYALVSADLALGYIQLTDSVVDELIGNALYTSPSQQGIQQANDRPPLCKDLALFRDKFMVYANISTKQRLAFTLVGTTSLYNGGAYGKSITLAGVTYTFGATEIISGAGSPKVAVSNTGVAAADIDATARSLVRVINRYASNTTIYAYYLSGPEDLPGQIMIEERGVGASAYTVQANDTNCSAMFFPAPPVGTTNSDSTSTNKELQNYLAISKDGEFEAVPLTSLYPVGPRNNGILRIIPLQSSLIIIKEVGVYRMSGTSATSFEITDMDASIFCKAPESIAVCQNQVFMLSDQGVVVISENGVQISSRDIEQTFKRVLKFTNLAACVRAVGYESEKQYQISLPLTTDDTAAAETYVYNTVTKTWMGPWEYGFVDAVVAKATDQLYLALPEESAVYAERKDYEDTDYADPEFSVTITSISDDSVTFTSAEPPQIGWVIKQGATGLPIDSFTQGDTDWTATLSEAPPDTWVAGAADMFPSVGFEIEWLPWTAKAPGVMKQGSMVAIFADSGEGQNTATSLSPTFRTNLDGDLEEDPVDTGSSAWGEGPWGEFPWGGAGDPLAYETTVPSNKQYFTRLMLGVKHYRAHEKLVIGGFGIVYGGVSERTGRTPA